MAQPRAPQGILPSTKHPPLRIPYPRAPVADSAAAHKALPATQVFFFFEYSAAAGEVSVLRGLACLSCSAGLFFLFFVVASVAAEKVIVCVCVRARVRKYLYIYGYTHVYSVSVQRTHTNTHTHTHTHTHTCYT